MSKPKFVPSKKDAKIKKFLIEKVGELIAEAAKFNRAGDEIWTMTYLRSAISVLEAARNL